MKGILFGEKHTYNDWDLILTEKPDISFPEVKTNYIDLSGADGQIDLTEVLTGEVKYQNRTGSLNFVKVGERSRWNSIKSTIADFLHGKRMQIILDDDLSYYYIGRFNLNEWKSDKKTGSLVIDYNLEPYKYELFSTIEPWEWNPFSFEDGIIRNYDSLLVQPNTTITLIGSRKTVVPTLTINSNDGNGFYCYGRYGLSGENTWFNLPNGTYKDPSFIIREGEQSFTFVSTELRAGYGSITVDFRGGRL